MEGFPVDYLVKVVLAGELVGVLCAITCEGVMEPGFGGMSVELGGSAGAVDILGLPVCSVVVLGSSMGCMGGRAVGVERVHPKSIAECMAEVVVCDLRVLLLNGLAKGFGRVNKGLWMMY